MAKKHFYDDIEGTEIQEKELVTAVPAEETHIVETPKEKTYRICVRGKLSVYKHPTFEAPVIGHLTHGGIVTSSEQKNEWLKITFGNNEGWIMKKRTVEV